LTVSRVGLLLLLLAGGAPVSLRAQRAKLLVPLVDLEAAAARDSLDPLVHYDVALGYWVSGQFDLAEHCLKRAAAIEPKLAAAYLGLAYLPFARQPKLWKELGKKKVSPRAEALLHDSYRLFRRAFMLDPLVDLKIYGLVVPPREAIVVGRNATETYAALIRGFESFWDGQYTQSYSWLDQALQKMHRKPDDVPEVLLWYHGLAAAHVGFHDPALADFRSLLSRALDQERTDTLVRTFSLPSNQIRYVLADITNRAGRSEEALALYQETVANDLGLYMGHVRMAEIYESRRQWDQAILERRRAVEAQPEDASLHYDLGNTLAQALRFSEAAEALNESLRLNPENARTPYVLGRVLLRLNDPAGARDAFRRFVAIAPGRFGAQVSEASRYLADQP
jgi:tetratricopeptide (TPR) repeat protein